MQHDLGVAQRIIYDKDKRLDEQEKLIMALGEEVKTKEALQAQLNEQQIKAQLKRQNVLDVSISQKSASVSDNSRITGFRRQFTNNALLDSDKVPLEDLTPTILNLGKNQSVSSRQNKKLNQKQEPVWNTQDRNREVIPDEMIHLHTNQDILQPILSEGLDHNMSRQSDPFDIIDTNAPILELRELTRFEIPMKVKTQKENKSHTISPINGSPAMVNNFQFVHAEANEESSMNNENTQGGNPKIVLNKSMMSISEAAKAFAAYIKKHKSYRASPERIQEEELK